MKKIGIRLLVLTLLIGCSKKAENLENKIELELNHEEIMAGDFSSFAGDMLRLYLKAVFYLPLEIFPEKKPIFHRHIAMIAVFLWERDGARVHIEIGFMHSALGHMGMAV